jgi:hypothetical protein
MILAMHALAFRSSAVAPVPSAKLVMRKTAG